MNYEEISNLDTEAQIAVIFRGVEEYHKEKTRCAETCKDQGRRIGQTESDVAVFKEEMINMKGIVEKIENRLFSMSKTVFIIVGIGIVCQILASVLVTRVLGGG